MTDGMLGCSAIVCMGPACQGKCPVPIESLLPLGRSQRHPLAPGFLNRLPSFFPSEGTSDCAGRRVWACRRRPRCQCCPLEPSRSRPLSPWVREPPSSVRPGRGCRRSGQEQVRNDGVRFGGIPDWGASPGQRGCALHAALTAARPVLSVPPQPPPHSWGVSDLTATGGCADGTSPCCPWTLPCGA